jgi:hypothetical protein
MIDDGDCGEIGGMKIGRGNRSTRRKPAAAPLCLPQIPHDQTRARTRSAAVGSQWLTAWAMARPRNTGKEKGYSSWHDSAGKLVNIEVTYFLCKKYWDREDNGCVTYIYFIAITVTNVFPVCYAAMYFHLFFWQTILVCRPVTGQRPRNNETIFAARKLNFNKQVYAVESRDSSDGIATDYGLDDQGVGVRVPVLVRNYTSPCRPQRLWGPPSLLSNGYRGLFPRRWSGRGVKLTTHLQLEPRSRKCGSIHPLPCTPSWRSA